MARKVILQLPEETVSAINVHLERLLHEAREAAVLLWFEEGRLSQGRAALSLELSRGEFFDLLLKHRVSTIQLKAEELE
jgi:predicted HTH domain antitoxin